MSKGSLANVAVVVGVLLLLLIPVWSVLAMPAVVENSASEMCVVVEMEGTVRLLNGTTGELDSFGIGMLRRVEISRSGEISMVNETTTTYDISSGELLGDSFQMSIERRCHPVERTISGRSDSARWTFPMETQRCDYLLVDGELSPEFSRGTVGSDSVLVRYDGEDVICGTDVYRFVQDTVIYGDSVAASFDAPEGSTEEIHIRCTYWVEPLTGQLVDMERSSKRYITFPDLTRYPADLDVSVPLVGSAALLNASRLGDDDAFDRFNMTVHRRVRVTEDLGSVCMVETSTELINRDTGEPLEDEFQYPGAVDGIDPWTGDIVTGYGDAPRSGKFTFPMGLGPENCTLWSYETESPVTAVYLDTVYMDGEPFYRFRLEERDRELGPMTMDGVEFLRYQTSDIIYTVEPVTGMVVDAAGSISQTGRFPDLAMMPSDLNLSYEIRGWARMMDRSEMDPWDMYDVFDMNLTKRVAVVSRSDGVLNVAVSTTGSRDDGAPLPWEFLENETVYPVNPRTYEYLEGRDGRLSFPVGAYADEYWLWSQEAGAPLPAVYAGDGEVMGVFVRIYSQEADMLYLEDLPIPMTDNELSLYYSGRTDYYVEPETGTVLDISANGNNTAVMGRIAEVPPDMRYAFWFEGVLDSVVTGRQEINLTKTLVGVGTEADGERKIRLIYDNNTMRNVTTDELIDLGTVSDLCAVDSSNSTHVAGFVPDVREGGFYFPQHCEKRDYPVWNQEMGLVDTAMYQREVDYDGLLCYQYLVEYRNRAVGPGLTYDNRVVYTVEPVSGMIVDTVMSSSQKASGFPLTKLDIRYTPECVKNKTDEGRRLKALIEALDDRNVLAAEFYYRFTDDQVAENVAFAREMMRRLPLSNSTVTTVLIDLVMDGPAARRAREGALSNATLIKRFSGKRVLVMEMNVSFTDSTVEEMAVMADGNVKLLAAARWGVPSFLVLSGGVLLIAAVSLSRRRWGE